MSQNIALLGPGTMGAGLASNLLKAGFSLIVNHRTAAKAQPLISAGTRLAFSAAEAAKGAAILVSMFADGRASREIWAGENGALAAVAPRAILIEPSTVSPAWRAQFVALSAAQSVELIDAPVTGSRAPAEAGQLCFLCEWERRGARGRNACSRP